MKIIQLTFTTLIGVVFLGLSPHQISRVDISKPGHYKLNLVTSKQIRITCSIEVIPYSRSASTPDLSNGWGSDRDTSWGPTYTLFREIELRINDALIKIPLSCYADLTNPSSVDLAISDRNYQMEIRGGDGAGSYITRIDFNKTRILGRSVHEWGHGGTWEQTVYHPSASEYR